MPIVGEIVVSVIMKSVFKHGSTLPHSASAGIDVHVFGQRISFLQVCTYVL